MITVGKGVTELHRPERSRVEVAGPVQMRQFLEAAYGVKLRLKAQPAAPMTHVRTDVGLFAIEEVHLPGELEAAPDPINKVAVVWATAGKVKGHSGKLSSEATPGEITLTTQPDLQYSVLAQDLRVVSLLMDPALVAGVGMGIPSNQAPPPIRFRSFQPVDAPAGRLWKDTVSYVKNSVLANDTIATPLVLGQASRLLAAITLSTFPNTATVDPTPYDYTDHKPVLLARAIEFIDANAANDISLADIAEAVHVTPRAVQYMFRRHLETTPLQYLRRVRLHHAQQDLLGADRMQETVTAIAARWGFVHTGRFAVLYRQTYGQSPHTTLRG